MSVILSYLFVNRLLTVFAESRKAGGNEHRPDKFMAKISVLARFVTLAIVGVTSGFLAMVFFGLIKWFTFLLTDIILNGWCIFLMYSENQKFFYVLCGYCHTCTGKCVLYFVDRKSKKTFLQVYKSVDLAANITAPQSNMIVTPQSNDDGIEAMTAKVIELTTITDKETANEQLSVENNR